MRHALITANLAPMLLVQGRHVRRTALELSEAAGPRAGMTSPAWWVDLLQALASYLGLSAKRLNQGTSQALPGLPDTWRLIDLDVPLTAEFLPRDGFHPNEEANRIWYERVLAAVGD